MIAPIDIAAFLRRIGYDGPTAPTIDNLRALHRSHLLSVPFENVDIHLGKRIVLDEQALFDKIVRQSRGGFCFELNGLFATVLRGLGYDVTLLAAQVFDADGEAGRDFVHLTLLVRLAETRWLADVGFGEAFIEPLSLDIGSEPQVIDGVAYRIVLRGDRHLVEQRQSAEAWRPRYAFTLVPRALWQFSGMCDDLQIAPDSHFRRGIICTRLTGGGRVTLTGSKLVFSGGDERKEIAVESRAAFAEALRREFDITLPEGEPSCLPP